MSSSLVVACLLGVNFLLAVCQNCGNCGLQQPTSMKDLEDNFGSPNNLTDWAKAEQEIYKYFKLYFNDGKYDKGPPISISLLARYFKDYEDSNGLNKKNEGVEKKESLLANEVAHNPIKTYRMLYRINKYQRIIEAFGYKTFQLSSDERANIWDILHVDRNSVPKDNDIKEAMDSIIRLYYIYEFNLTEFASGVIAGIQTDTRLDAIHCYEIGIHASRTGYHDISMEWLELAYSKVQFQSDLTVERKEIEQALLESIINHDEVLEDAPDWVPTMYNDSLWDNNYQVPGGYALSNHSRIRRKTIQFEAWKKHRDSQNYVFNFWELCSGRNFQTSKEAAQLYCWQDSGKNHVNVLSPSKIELLSKRPYLIQIYDAIESKMAERIIKKSEINLKRSLVNNFDEETKESSPRLTKQRTSATSWLKTISTENVTDPDLVEIERRIESITGLDAKKQYATEDLQVVSYVVGRHYNAHFDSVTNHNPIILLKSNSDIPYSHYP